MTANTALQIELIDFKKIKLVKDNVPLEIVKIQEDDGFFLNEKFTTDFRIRKSIYEMLKAAQQHLPENHYFMIYEAYRPLARQMKLWDMATDYLKEKYPDIQGQELRDLTETFVADPHNGIGSGHQACCAVDISLCGKDGGEYDMGSPCQEISEFAKTASTGISKQAQKNRAILVNALEKEGLVNYSSEWWHFSYGDHQWAYLTDKTEALFGPIYI